MKKFKLKFLLLFMIFLFFSFIVLDLVIEYEAQAFMIGDLNNDSYIDSLDAMLLQRYLLSMIDDLPVDDKLKVADLNGDGIIDSNDYILLTRYILQIIDKFPVEEKEKNDIESKVQELLSQMTLEEKVGQMVQADIAHIDYWEISNYHIGSILAGGSSFQGALHKWRNMTKNVQEAAAATRLAIPVLYGVDAVHGHNNVDNAVIFPHNIGLGAANDPDLMRRIANVTASEMISSGVNWNFAPCVAIARDERWGRTYESYSENTEIVNRLAIPYLEGLEEYDIAATAKHFIADGGTKWGTGGRDDHGYIDQGNAIMTEEELREIHLPPFKKAVDAGVKSVMISYSSWNGVKCHEHSYLINDILRGELGFEGIVLSDWEAIHQIDKNSFEEQVITAVNAGIDMLMEPEEWLEVINILISAVNQGRITESRIDDAVSRILRVKFEIGLFENPLGNKDYVKNEFGSNIHREIAREAVRKSLVLLKNDNNILPLSKDSRIYISGSNADNIGNQCGGWTIFWQGGSGDIIEGTTIKEGIEKSISGQGHLVNDIYQADLAIVVVGEEPYAEMHGDDGELRLSNSDIWAINQAANSGKPVVLILVSGRPLMITEQVDKVDALLAAWLPGTEGQGVADVLFGDYRFTGKLSFTWPRSIDQIPINEDDLQGKDPLFPFGFGLETY
ncbi:glycoside hydrolase family 3 N-terminal domain-containing protein [Natronospora cellulosivora (SeqCode)]